MDVKILKKSDLTVPLTNYPQKLSPFQISLYGISFGYDRYSKRSLRCADSFLLGIMICIHTCLFWLSLEIILICVVSTTLPDTQSLYKYIDL